MRKRSHVADEHYYITASRRRGDAFRYALTAVGINFSITEHRSSVHSHVNIIITLICPMFFKAFSETNEFLQSRKCDSIRLALQFHHKK